MKKNRESILIIVGFISLIYFFILSMISVRISFSEFWLVLGVILVITRLYKKRKKESTIKKNHPIIKRIMLIIFLIIMLSFSAIEGMIIHSGTTEERAQSDYLLILGAGLEGDKMSLSLHQRMVKSLEYLEDNPNIKIIVSGGQGPGENMAEGEAMKRYLMKNGISEERIIVEDKSTSTYENLKFTRKKLQEIDKRENIRLTIITNNFHVYRAKMLARRQGFIAYGFPAPLHPILTPNFYVRESLALIKSFIFDK